MYDAITNDHPYRKVLTDEAAFAELQKIAGAQFGPGLVEIFPVSFRDQGLVKPRRNTNARSATNYSHGKR